MLLCNNSSYTVCLQWSVCGIFKALYTHISVGVLSYFS